MVSFNGFMSAVVAFLSNRFFFCVVPKIRLSVKQRWKQLALSFSQPSALHLLACLLYSFDIPLNHIATCQKQKTAERKRESVRESGKTERAAEIFSR